MEEIVKIEMTKAEAEQFRALVDECLVRMREANERMDRDQEEIDQLKTETRAMLNQIKATLNVETIFLTRWQTSLR